MTFSTETDVLPTCAVSNVYTNFDLLFFFVFKLRGRTGQMDRQTDGRTDGRTRCVMQLTNDVLIGDGFNDNIP